jgi:hypothetical protein
MERYQKCVCKSRETIPLITHFFVFPELFSGRRRGKRGVSRNQGSQINQIGDEKLVMNQDLDDTKKTFSYYSEMIFCTESVEPHFNFRI